MIITSRSNPLIKEIYQLSNKKVRKAEKKYVVEGFKMIREAYNNGKEIEVILGLEDSLSKLGDTGSVKTFAVSESVLSYLTDTVTPQGVIAVVKEDERIFSMPSAPCVLLDRISDPGNLGTIIRTCSAVGVKDLYLLGCCDEYSPKCIRSSMSGIYFVNTYVVSEEEVQKLSLNIPFIVADMGGENIYDFTPPEKYCLIIGNEASGVSERIKSMAVHTVKIPMQSHSESLNAGVALGITLYELTEGKGLSLLK